jgi:penicillin-binding protein 2
VGLGFGLVVLALLRLQVVEHARYRDLAKENRVRLEVLRAPRGAIYDRNGELLVDSGPSFTILFQPFPAESAHRTRQVQSPEWLARVAEFIEADTLEIRRRVTAANRSGQSAVLRSNAPFAVLAAVEELRDQFPGIDVQIEPLRRYAHGTLAAHLLGYANEINDRDLAEREGQGYHAGDLIGRSGIERSYEDVLRGVDGAEFVVVNAMGQRVSKLSEGPPRLPVRGNDLVLALDLRVQRALEEAMGDVERGAAVAIDPRDGGILGLVSRPAFDPNEFSSGISVRRWRDMTSGGRNPLLNRAIQGV